jgi:hypothetical protein
VSHASIADMKLHIRTVSIGSFALGQVVAETYYLKLLF